MPLLEQPSCRVSTSAGPPPGSHRADEPGGHDPGQLHAALRQQRRLGHGRGRAVARSLRRRRSPAVVPERRAGQADEVEDTAAAALLLLVLPVALGLRQQISVSYRVRLRIPESRTRTEEKEWESGGSTER